MTNNEKLEKILEQNMKNIDAGADTGINRFYKDELIWFREDDPENELTRAIENAGINIDELGNLDDVIMYNFDEFIVIPNGEQISDKDLAEVEYFAR